MGSQLVGVLYIVAAACRKVVAWVVQVHGSKGRVVRSRRRWGGWAVGGGDALRGDEVRAMEVNAARCASSGN